MTPELKAAAERVRRTINEDTVRIYETRAKPSWHKGDWNRAEQLDWAQEKYNNDCEQIARAFLAEHPADEDEPVKMEELCRAARECDIQLIVIQDGTVDVWGTVHPKTRGQLRALLKGLGHGEA